MDMNIFDMFNVDVPEEYKEDKAKVKAKDKVRTQKSKPKTTSVKKHKVDAIYTGYHEPFALTEDKEYTEEELELILSGVYADFSGCKFVFDTLADKKAAYAYLPECNRITKGTVSVTGNTRLILGNKEFDLSSLIEKETNDVKLSELNKILTTELKVLEKSKLSYYVNSKAEMIIPCIEESVVSDKLTIQLPLNVLLPGREIYKIDRDVFHMMSCENAESEEKGNASEGVSFTKEMLQKILVKKWSELGKGMGIYLNGQFAVVFPKYAPVQEAVSGKNAEKIPVDGTSISLVFTRIPLSREMFDGASEVTNDDILRLLSKEYPEYSKSRTEIMYDKSSKLIIPVLKGSKKGSGLIPTVENKEQAAKLEEQLIPYYIVEDGVKKRIEKTLFGRFILYPHNSKVEYSFLMKKIPYEIKEQCMQFFQLVMDLYDTEAMLQLFYDNEKDSYFLHCPSQVVSLTEVSIIRDTQYERNPRYTLVMDIHSHGRLNCTFSPIDDEDEMGTRMYGVFYNLKETPTFDLRAGCKGIFTCLLEKDIFELKNSDAGTACPPLDKWLARVFKGTC